MLMIVEQRDQQLQRRKALSAARADDPPRPQSPVRHPVVARQRGAAPGDVRAARGSMPSCRTHVQRLDPTRPTTFAMDQGWDNGVGRVVDVLGFNYRTNQIEAYHTRHPDQPIIGTETGSTVATRGEYANDPARHIVRAYDTEHPWWATTAEEWWTIVADRPYIAGGFVWTGFDYRGEPTPFDTLPEHQLAVRDPRHLRLPQGQLLLLPRLVAAGSAAGASASALELAGTRGAADRGLGARQYRRSRAAAQRPLARAQGDAAQPAPRLAGALCAGTARGDRIQGWAVRGARRARDQRSGSVGAAHRRSPDRGGGRSRRCQRDGSSMREGGRCRPRTICCASTLTGGEVIGVGNGNPEQPRTRCRKRHEGHSTALAQAIVRRRPRSGRCVRRERWLIGSRMTVVAR